MKLLIDNTKTWIKDFIIGEDICPFAYEPFTNELINYKITSQDSIENDINQEIQNLISQKFQTSFLIFSKFISYYQLLDLITFLNSTINLSNEYQFIAFHPDFHFEGLAPDEIANYVNKSPYPMIHIINNNELDNLLDSEQARNLSIRNEEKLKKLPNTKILKYFSHLKDNDEA